MPEGPSLVILKEETAAFRKKKITAASGTVTSFDPKILKGRTIRDIRTWGKHYLICFDDFTIRIHLLMFGTYLINEHSDREPRLHMAFGRGKELNFYTCAVKKIDEDLDEVYDWTSDVMNSKYDKKAARKKLKEGPDQLACDAILNQEIFSGAGNIFKNEVLYRIRVHPESRIHALPPLKLTQLIDETVHYGEQFFEWKKAFVLKKHWLAHTKKTCKRCNLPFTKKYAGKTKRRTFFCENCQVLYQ